jgi:uncharacterized protein Usg
MAYLLWGGVLAAIAISFHLPLHKAFLRDWVWLTIQVYGGKGRENTTNFYRPY